MGIIIRQSIQNTLISYIGIGLGFITTILMFPNILSPDQYGLTRILISLALISSQFAHLGIKNTVIKFFPRFEKSEDSRFGLLTIAVIVPLIGFALFSLIFFLFQEQLISLYSDQSNLFSEYYLYLLPLVLFVLFFDVFNSYIRSLQDSVTGSIVNEVGVRLLTIVLLALYFFKAIDFDHFVIFFVLTYGMQPAYLIYYLYKKGELNFKIPFRNGNLGLAKHIGIYGVYSFLGGLSTLLVANIDILMLGSLTDLANAGIYAIAFYVGSVIAVPQRSIGKIATPILSGFLENENYTAIEELYKRTSLNQVIAGSLLFVGVWANMHNLMGLLPEEYRGTQWIIVIIGAAKLFDMATGLNGGIIMNSKYFRFDFYTNVFLVLVAVTANFLLIPLYGITGAAIATAISLTLYNIIKLTFVWMKFGMQPFQPAILAIGLIAAVCLLISWQIPYLFNFYLDVLIRSSLITILFLASILAFGLSNDVRQLLLSGWSYLRRYGTENSDN